MCAESEMTLPTNTTTLGSKEFNNFNAMSSNNYAASTSPVGTTALQQQQATQQPPPALTRLSPPATNTTQGLVLAGAASTQPTATSPPAVGMCTSLDLAVEPVMPGIYLTKNFIAWHEQNLRAHGFTHIIIIDKHIQELYYPSPVFKLATQSPPAHSHDVDDPFDCYYTPANSSSLSFGKEFEAIDLNFGEKSYLTTVLPNCYRAVKFINKALQTGGTILIIDCNGGEQKCVTIVVAYLMYKHNISFSHAFARLKDFYKKADLDRFYISQLYEYEPILQVQRAQSRGHSCSRELHSAILKRKQHDDDVSFIPSATTTTTTTAANEFFDTFNPLSQFNTNTGCSATQALPQHAVIIEALAEQQQSLTTAKSTTTTHNQQQQFATTTFSAATASYAAWDDYAME